MSEQLISLVYEKLEKFNDPISKLPLNRNNNSINIVCKDGHANITIIINPKEETRYNDLNANLNEALKDIQGLLSINIIFTAEKNSNTKKEEKNRFQSRNFRC